MFWRGKPEAPVTPDNDAMATASCSDTNAPAAVDKQPLQPKTAEEEGQFVVVDSNPPASTDASEKARAASSTTSPQESCKRTAGADATKSAKKEGGRRKKTAKGGGDAAKPSAKPSKPGDAGTQTKSQQPTQREVDRLREALQRIQKELRSGSTDKLAKIESICTSALASPASKKSIRKGSNWSAKDGASNKDASKTKKSGNGGGALGRIFDQQRGRGPRFTSNNNPVMRLLEGSGATGPSRRGDAGGVPSLHAVVASMKSSSGGATGANDIRTLSSPAESDHPICVRIREGLRTATDEKSIQLLVQQAESHQIKDLAELGRKKLARLEKPTTS